MRWTLLALLLLACDSSLTPRPVGVLSAEPPLVLFQSAPEGALQVRGLGLRNTGAGDLRLSPELQLDGDASALSVSWRTPTDAPIDLAPGEVADLVVAWLPDGAPVEATLRVQSTRGEHLVAIRTVPTRSALVVVPNPIDLGTVDADTVAETLVTLVNLGADHIEQLDATLDGGHAGRFGLSWVTPVARLAPDAQATLKVVFRADDPRPSTTTLVLRAANLAPMSVPVRANTDRPCLRADPVHFSRALIGRTTDLTLDLTACTDEPVQIAGLSTQGDPAFSLTPPSLPLTLEPGATVGLPVHFRPVREGTTQAIVHLRSDDPLQPSLPVILTGRGVHNTCPEARPQATVAGPGDAPHLLLDGGRSVDRDAPNQQPQRWRWSVLARPEGGQAEVEEAPGVADDPRTATARFAPDAPGTWRVALTVEDAFSCVDQATLAVVVRDGPVDVQLEWAVE